MSGHPVAGTRRYAEKPNRHITDLIVARPERMCEYLYEVYVGRVLGEAGRDIRLLRRFGNCGAHDVHITVSNIDPGCPGHPTSVQCQISRILARSRLAKRNTSAALYSRRDAALSDFIIKGFSTWRVAKHTDALIGVCGGGNLECFRYIENCKGFDDCSRQTSSICQMGY
jgi:hypothetical protein